MHPANVGLLKAAGIDCCVLANNHTADFGFRGLIETLESLHRAGIKSAGAGGHGTEAAAPAIREVASELRWSSLDMPWIPPASRRRGRPARLLPGVNFLTDLSPEPLCRNH